MKISLFLFSLYLLIININSLAFDKLIFEEKFDGETLNLSKWDYDLGNGVYGWGNDEKEYYRKNNENIYIENNQLHIIAKKENYGNMNYTSARITTKKKFQFRYGYVETRIKVPKAGGSWPAFWMLGANIDEIDWPGCGEIDIVETKNEDEQIHNVLIWKDEYNQKQIFDITTDINKKEEFHKYGLIWIEDEIIMYIDDEETFRKQFDEINKDIFNKPFYLLINLAIGGNWPGFAIDNDAFPLEMVIDYVKIYQAEKDYKYIYKYLIFFDEFTDSELDRTKWAYDIGTGENGWGTYQKQYYTNRKENIFLSDSKLYIRAKKESYKNSEYTSGRITTKYNMQFTYGIIETKIKFPSVDGVSPGLFLSGLFNNGIWPQSGSIDALIGVDNKNEINSGCTWGNSYTYYKRAEVDLTKFNEYSIIWDKKYITIFANDLEIYKIDISPEDLIAFHNPFYLNLNVAVGGYNVYKSIDNSAFPIDMEIDYIKIYQYELNNTINKNISNINLEGIISTNIIKSSIINNKDYTNNMTVVEATYINNTLNKSISQEKDSGKNNKDKDSDIPSYIIDTCSGIEFFQDLCNITNKTIDKNNYTVSTFINDILDDIDNGKFNDIFNETIAENKSIIKTENNASYIISTVSSQYSTNYTTVDLQDCESKIKESYSLDKNESLILLKVEYDIEQFKIPITEYQLFTKNGTKLHLNICDTIPEIISIPVDINENEKYIHNPNSDFYEDKCTPYTSEYNTDLTVYDRKINYNKKYLALCEKNCEFIEYNNETKKVKCKCQTKIKFPFLPNSDRNINELLDRFIDVIKHGNWFLFTCFKETFSSNGLKNNSGSYINIVIISIIIFCAMFFIIKGYNFYENKIMKLIEQNTENNDNSISKINNYNIKFKMAQLYDSNNQGSINNINTNINNTNIQHNNNINQNSFDLNTKNEKYNYEEKNDIEIKNGTFCYTYVSFIKKKQLIYSNFFLEDEYNLIIIKICLFLFALCSDYAINALFYNDSTMHKLYEDKGEFNISYRLRNSLFSFGFSYLLSKFISYWTLSEEKNIKKDIENNNDKNNGRINKLPLKYKIKFLLFFIFLILFHLVFWYYLSSFCAIYKNTQRPLLENTVISILISLFIYPYIIGLILCPIIYNCPSRGNNKCINLIYDILTILGNMFI